MTTLTNDAGEGRGHALKLKGMALRNTTARWGLLSQAFHWIVVVLVITQVTLALSAQALPTGMEKLATLARHKSVGITILGLATLRLLWRWMNPVPALPDTLRPYERRLARGTHFALYLLLFAMPLSGWMMSSARGFPVSWFSVIQLPDLVGPSRPLYETLHGVHEFLAYSLGAAVLLHIAGALKHHFVLRDGILRRMLPFAGALVAALVLVPPTFAAPRPFVVEPAGSKLEFTFVQAGAETTGAFRKFDVRLTLDDAAPAGNRLEVRIPVASLDTHDEERDGILRDAELFDVRQHPLATFTSTSIERTAPGRYEAVGKLSIRGVSREVRVPFTLAGTRMEGGTTIRRLDFGIGQGDWKSTEWVGNDVQVRFALRLKPAQATAAVTRASHPGA
jgi:cytochrome b561/polyisoprenoid-binding protein YceI